MSTRVDGERSAILAVDLGTQRLKVAAVDGLGGTVLETEQVEVVSQSPNAGAVEQEASQWWHACCRATRSVLSRLSPATRRIAAIGLAGHMHSIVALDSGGSPIHRCLVWADSRAWREAEEVGRALQDAYWNPAIAAYSLPKLLWLKRNHPDVFARARWFLFPKDYLRFRMTGIVATDYSDASGSLLWDFEHHDWDRSLADRFGIPLDSLPPSMPSTTVAGPLNEAAALDLGLPRGTPVAVGCGDVAAAAWCATRGRTPGLHINAGTAVQVIQSEAKAERSAESASRYLFELGDGETYFKMGAVPSAGLSIEWARRLLGEGESLPDIDAKLDVKTLSMDSPMFLPYLQGTGTPLMLDRPAGSFVGLSMASGRSEMILAVMEGVALAILACAKGLRPDIEFEAGLPVQISGGITKSYVMRWLLVQLFGERIGLSQFSDMSLLGAAATASAAVGIVGSPHDVAAALTTESAGVRVEQSALDLLRQRFQMFEHWSGVSVEAIRTIG